MRRLKSRVTEYPARGRDTWTGTAPHWVGLGRRCATIGGVMAAARPRRPLVALPGRRVESAGGLRTDAVAVGSRYLSALERAGAQPAILPPFAGNIGTTVDDLRSANGAAAERAAEALAGIDALLMVGGADVDPARYGATRHPETAGVDTAQDCFEMALLRSAIERDMPVLAICRGMQVLNVVLGGTLIQHLPDDARRIGHRKEHHPVALEPESKVARAAGSALVSGHSVHHQAIDSLGRDLTITGRASDGTIEAVELPAGWVIGVQWHPEDTAGTDQHQQALFDALVQNAINQPAGRV